LSYLLVPGSLLRIKYSIQTIERDSNMVTKNDKRNDKAATKSRVKVGKLQLKKETVKDLTPGKQKQVKGGAVLYDKTHCGGST
jgi:hypothetical protein